MDNHGGAVPRESGGRRVLTTVAAAIAFAAVLIVAPVGSAQAKSAYTVDPSGPTSVTVEYGANWSFDYTMSKSYPNCGYCSSSFTVRIAGKTAPFASGVPDYGGDRALTFDNYTSPGGPLPVGVYVFSVSHRQSASNLNYGKSSAPVTLTVVPAKIPVSVDIQSDPNHASHAILSASGTGDFIEKATQFVGYTEGLDLNVPIPAGTWSFSVKDASGAVVHTAEVKSKSNTAAFATDYWTDVPPGTTFAATAAFAPDPSVAGQFAPSPSSAVSYTSPAAAAGEAPAPVPTAAPAAEPKTAGVGVPTWLVIAWAFVAAVLLIVLLAVVIRLGRLSRPAGAGPTDDGARQPEPDPKGDGDDA